MGMAERPEDPAPALRVTEGPDCLRLELSGNWRRTGALPAHPATAGWTRVRVEASGVGGHDAVLAAWIHGLGRSLPEGCALELSGLPPQAAAWLALREEETTEDVVPERLPFLEQLGDWASSSHRSWGRAVAHIGDCALGAARLVAGKGRANWAEFPQLLRTAGPDGLPIVLLLGFLTGVIMAYVGLIQLGKVGADVYVANLVGLAMAREMGALMTGVIACGRTATAYASQLGSMNVTQETDALRAIGLRPAEYLAVPRLLAVTATLPLLSVFATAAGILGGMTVAVGYGLSAEQYLNQVVEAVSVSSFLAGVTKAHAFALIAAWAGCYRGAVARPTARGVGEAATTAAVLGITLLVVADALFAVLFDLFDI
jgi:phospholipid/cholesterol/gamma-HCH transport system permease protein